MIFPLLEQCTQPTLHLACCAILCNEVNFQKQLTFSLMEMQNNIVFFLEESLFPGQDQLVSPLLPGHHWFCISKRIKFKQPTLVFNMYLWHKPCTTVPQRTHHPHMFQQGVDCDLLKRSDFSSSHTHSYVITWPWVLCCWANYVEQVSL